MFHCIWNHNQVTSPSGPMQQQLTAAAPPIGASPALSQLAHAQQASSSSPAISNGAQPAKNPLLQHLDVQQMREKYEKDNRLAQMAVALWCTSSRDFLLQIRNIRAGLPLDKQLSVGPLPISRVAEPTQAAVLAQWQKHAQPSPLTGLLQTTTAQDKCTQLQQQLKATPALLLRPSALDSQQHFVAQVLRPLETLVHGKLDHLAKDAARASPLRHIHMEISRYFLDVKAQHARFVETFQFTQVLHTKHWEAAIKAFDTAKDHIVASTDVVTQAWVLTKSQLDEHTQLELKQWSEELRNYEQVAIGWLSKTHHFEKSAIELVQWLRSHGQKQAEKHQHDPERSSLNAILGVASAGRSPIPANRPRPNGSPLHDSRLRAGPLEDEWSTVLEAFQRTDLLLQQLLKQYSGNVAAHTQNLNWSPQLMGIMAHWTDTFAPFYPAWKQAMTQIGEAHAAALRRERNQEAVLQPIKDRLGLMRHEQDFLREGARSLQDITPDRVSISLSVSDQSDKLQRKYQAELKHLEDLQLDTKRHLLLFEAAKAVAPPAEQLVWLQKEEDLLRRYRLKVDSQYTAEVQAKTMLFTAKIKEVNQQALEDYCRRVAKLTAQAQHAEQQLWDRFETQDSSQVIAFEEAKQAMTPNPMALAKPALVAAPAWQHVKPALLQLEEAVMKQYQRTEPSVWTAASKELQTVVQLISGAVHKFEAWCWSQRAALTEWHARNFLTIVEKLVCAPELGLAIAIVTPKAAS